MSDTPSILNIDEVRFQWPGSISFGLHVPVFEMQPGESVLLLGESGSGKSTLLSLICGTVVAQSGQVLVNGVDIGAQRASARDRLRAEQIGVIFQQFNLLPFASVLDNILLPLRFAPQRRKRAGDTQAQAAQLCADLGLPSDVLHMQAGRLSVGQQQRVAAARAIIGHPPLVIADEPTSALDADTQAGFLDLLFGHLNASGAALLMVSHDARLGNKFDRVVNLRDIATVERSAP